MSGLLVCSSRTGNTLMVAESLVEVLPEDTILIDAKSAPDPVPFDWILSAFWVDRGGADALSTAFLKKLSKKPVGFFGTLGAYPDSQHARDVEETVRALVQPSNKVLGCFLCQGRIDPVLAERFKQLPPDHLHGWTPERAKRHADAASHPDDADLRAAREAALRFIARVPEMIGT